MALVSKIDTWTILSFSIITVARNDAKRHRHVLPAKFDATVFTIIVGLVSQSDLVLFLHCADDKAVVSWPRRPSEASSE